MNNCHNQIRVGYNASDAINDLDLAIAEARHENARIRDSFAGSKRDISLSSGGILCKM